MDFAEVDTVFDRCLAVRFTPEVSEDFESELYQKNLSTASTLLR